MEIDITSFVNGEDPAEYSASMMELGDNAGRITWANAMTQAATAPLLTTPGELDALRDWARETGAWDDDTTAAWSPDECNALFVQLISGDLREIESVAGRPDWAKWEVERDGGGSLYPGDGGRIYYYLGS